VCPNLIWREHLPHLGNEPRQFPREFRIVGSSASEIQQFLGDHVIERHFKTKASLDVPSRVALLNPNLVEIRGTTDR
jgi:hypothetical protein